MAAIIAYILILAITVFIIGTPVCLLAWVISHRGRRHTPRRSPIDTRPTPVQRTPENAEDYRRVAALNQRLAKGKERVMSRVAYPTRRPSWLLSFAKDLLEVGKVLLKTSHLTVFKSMEQAEW